MAAPTRRKPLSRPRAALLTLGCAKNLVDSEHFASLLEAAGVEVCTDPARARAVIINTCGFIDPAKEESIDAILDIAALKGSGQVGAVIVTGCLSQRYAEELRERIPEADAILGIDPAGAARAALRALGVAEGALPTRCNVRAHRLTPAAWSYLKIAEGCDNRCAYCAIPSIRGRLVSRPLEGLVREARFLLKSGVKELSIIAQDTTAYGMDRGRQELHVLLRRLCRLPGEKWVRLLYTHPAHFYPELMDVLASEPSLCPYLDIPLQHISDRILRGMGRKVTRADIERLIERLRTRIPHLTLRTTFLVGFPGETERDFAELLDFVRAVRFERLGAFVYSREEGTRAARLARQVPKKVKEARRHELMMLQKQIARELAAARLGEKTRVLIEQAASGRRPATRQAGKPAFGRSPHEAPDVDPVILLPGARGLKPGQMVDVEITGSAGYDCIARVRHSPR